jgi:serine/threonine protein phosphatase 1
VLERARHWQADRIARGSNFHILIGNHEEMLLEALEKEEVLRHFVTYGGKETILSFGLDADTYTKATWPELQALMRQVITPDWLAFIRSFVPIIRIGDYAFVHAGVKPDRPLEAQNASDLRWIREPFLSSTANHGAVIVHGHTITEDAVLRPNRIGIDTGAYQSGRLTALLLEGSQRWLISALESRQEPMGSILVSRTAA